MSSVIATGTTLDGNKVEVAWVKSEGFVVWWRDKYATGRAGQVRLGEYATVGGALRRFAKEIQEN